MSNLRSDLLWPEFAAPLRAGGSRLSPDGRCIGRWSRRRIGFGLADDGSMRTNDAASTQSSAHTPVRWLPNGEPNQQTGAVRYMSGSPLSFWDEVRDAAETARRTSQRGGEWSVFDLSWSRLSGPCRVPRIGAIRRRGGSAIPPGNERGWKVAWLYRRTSRASRTCRIRRHFCSIQGATLVAILRGWSPWHGRPPCLCAAACRSFRDVG